MERDLGSLIRNRRVQIAGSLVLAGAALLAGRGCLRGEQKAEPTPTPIATLVAARTAEPTAALTATVIPTPVPTEEPTPPPTPEPPPPTPKPTPPTPVPTPVRTPEPTPTARPNRAPVIDRNVAKQSPVSIGAIREGGRVVGFEYPFKVSVTDPDGDALSCGWTAIPVVPDRILTAGDCSGGTLKIFPAVFSLEAPLKTVTVTASDGRGGTDFYSWTAEEIAGKFR